MAQRTCRFLSAGILGLALAFSLASCGGSSPAPVDETTSQEEQAADAGASEDREAAEDSDPMGGLAFHENDYLTIGLADGWAVNTDVSENKHIENEDGSGYYFTAQYDDPSIGRRGFYVSVYDEPTYDWVSDYSDGSLPAETEHMKDIEALDPITIDGVELQGYHSQNTAMDGSTYWFGSYGGTVNGHYIEIFFTDGSEGNILLEDQIAMAKSVHIK